MHIPGSDKPVTFRLRCGTELYSSLEEKAAHLLYFLVKNHPCRR